MTPAVTEDLIESAPRSHSAFRRRFDSALHHRWAVVSVLIVGLIVGSLGGYLAGRAHPRTLAGLGYIFSYVDQGDVSIAFGEQLDPNYGRPPPPTLTSQDLAALDEVVRAEVVIVSAQSAIPVLCDTAIGQPGTSNGFGGSFPSTIFNVEGGRISELVWPLADAAAASRMLHTLVFQAQLCPDLPDSNASIRSSGVVNGIGDEYVVFYGQPTLGNSPGAVYRTTALVRVGSDLIEVSFTSDLVAAPDAETRCLQAAAVAAQVAAGS